MKRTFFAGMPIAAAMLAASCVLPRLDLFIPEFGSLRLALGSIQAKTITPDISTLPAYFELAGTGPEGETFSISTADEFVVLENLVFGTWHVTAEAFNSESRLVGEGTADVEIHSGETAALNIPISTVSGTGQLSISLSWNGELVANPSIAAQLAGGAGEVPQVDFTLTGNGTAAASLAGVASGYYTLSVNLLDGDAVIAGFSEVARVFTGETTTGSFTFDGINKPGQAVEILGEQFTLAWDPPPNSPVTAYRVYCRQRGVYTWTMLAEVEAVPAPKYIVTPAALNYGTYEFAVSSVHEEQESGLHGSMDDDASPPTGWFLVWSPSA